MSNLRITDAPELTARHITSPTQQGTCVGKPRQFAPPPDILPEPEPDTPHEAHATYHGVYLETVQPRRYYWQVTLDTGRTLDGYGYPSPVQAAKAYDTCVQTWNIRAPLNFGAHVGDTTLEEAG